MICEKRQENEEKKRHKIEVGKVKTKDTEWMSDKESLASLIFIINKANFNNRISTQMLSSIKDVLAKSPKR